MNSTSVRKLLNKNTLTGVEVGKAYIITRLRDKISNGEEVLLTEEELNILVARVTDQLEMDQLEAYVNFYSWMERAYLIAKGGYHHLYVGLSGLYLKIDSTLKSEQGFNTLKEITGCSNKKDDDYQKLRTFTEHVLFNMSTFDQIKDPEGLEYMRIVRDTVMKRLPELLAYNKSVSLFADFFKIPDILEAFQIDTKRLFVGINILNDKIVLLRNCLYADSKSESSKKLKILDDIFPIINIKDLEPSKKAVNKAVKSLKSSILNSNSAEIIKILFPF